MALFLDTDQWARQQFGSCDFGDVRRTRRLVKFAAQVAGEPDASTPGQTEKWADLKAAYRLIDNDKVPFDAIASPHWQATRQQTTGTDLIACDTTEVNFGWDNEATGPGTAGTRRYGPRLSVAFELSFRLDDSAGNGRSHRSGGTKDS